MKIDFKRKAGIRPVVFIDVDGVCVKWQSGLPYYLSQKNIDSSKALEMMLSEEFLSPEQLIGMDYNISSLFIRDYNKSDFIKYLAPYDDALKMINEMKHHWDFVALTALGTETETLMNRAFNLNALFPGAFKDIFACGIGAKKDEIISKAAEKYNDRVVMFIDDVAINIDSSAKVIPSIPRYHIVRGSRNEPKSECFTFKNLSEIKSHYLSMVFENEKAA